MNINKFYKDAKDSGIEVSEVWFTKSTQFDISLFRGEIDNYTSSTCGKILARGIYNGKLGYCSTEKFDRTTFPFIIKTIKDSSSLIEKKEEPIIFRGSPKYYKKNTFSESLENVPATEKINILHLLEDYCKSLDNRVTDVEVSYGETSGETLFSNSYGLKLKSKKNYFTIFCSVIVKDGDETKMNYDVFFDNDFSKFEYKTFAKGIVDNTLSLLHGENVKNGTYKVVLNNESVSNLLNAFLSNASAEKVQKHSSKFEGKLNTQIASKKLTIYEKPLLDNIFRSYFDDEGVAKKNKTVVDKGILKTYFYNLETAAKDNIESTGNGARTGSKIVVDFSNLVIKPGKQTEDQLFETIKNGLYITELSGLHAGLNAESGDFSLESKGYLVKDGKKDKALGLFVLSGNIFTLFNDIIAIGNNSKLLIDSNVVPSIAFKNLKYSAE